MEPDATSGVEPTPDSESPPAANEESSAAPQKPTPKYIRNSVMGGVVGLALIVLLQWVAPATDHQYANMASGLIALLTVMFVSLQVHLLVRHRGHSLVIPGLGVAIVALLVVLLRFDGFSGELVPQFKYRFASSSPQMRTLTDADPTVPVAAEPSPDAVALADSLGFLGSNRTAVIGSRLFAIPNDSTEVKTLWNQGIGQGWSSFAVSGDRAVTLEQRDEWECVTCYRLADGQLLWMQRHEARHQDTLGGVGPRSTPTIDDGDVYAQGATGRVWCLDLMSGQINWIVDLNPTAGWTQIESEKAIKWGRAGSPLIVDGLCIVPYGGPEVNQQTGRSLIALEAQSGDVRWAAGEDQISFASPALMDLGGKRQIVIVNEKTISGHNVKDGSLLWEFDWPGQSNTDANCAMVVPAGRDRFLIGKGYGGGSALVEVKADSNGKLSATALWDSRKVLKTKFTHACVSGDVAYAISNGSLEAVSLGDSEPTQLWVQPRSLRFGQGHILLVEDIIVAQSEPGEVVMVAADSTQYRELLRIPAMDAKTWNVPTVAGRHLLVRNDRQAICFLLPAVE